MKSSPVHPSVFRRWSLPLLCAVQSCERFAFLAMLPLFVPYAQERHALPAPTVLMVLAVLQALSYLGGLPGGWVADNRLGARMATMLGALLLALSYGALALNRASVFWPALGLMVIGHSLFRPGLHVLIARATGHDEQARERGFLWHYLAANIGYAAGALFGEWAHAARGWTTLFGGAAVASLLSAGLLMLGSSRLENDGTDVVTTPDQPAATSRHGNMAAVWLLCSVAVVFWLTAQQAGSSLAVFASVNTEPQIALLSHALPLGPGLFASLHGLLVIAMLPIFLYLHGRSQSRAGSTAGKLVWGYVATASAFALMAAASLRGGDAGRVSGAWLVGCYALLSLAEILLAPLGVSLVTQLAPRHKTAQAVGLWFAGSATGNGLAAVLGLCWDRWPHHRYFAVLAAVSLAAAAPLLSRRRHLDWLTAHAADSASQPEAEDKSQTMTPTASPDLDPVALPFAAIDLPASWARMLLVALPILLPASLIANVALPLPVRGVSAIVCGLALLFCGPFLLGHSLLRWARRGTAPAR
ncbi:MAG: MFS transporter [Myxococcales bacterium]|nr:MFS transporter [Myxococcales bacterium]